MPIEIPKKQISVASVINKFLLNTYVQFSILKTSILYLSMRKELRRQNKQKSTRLSETGKYFYILL